MRRISTALASCVVGCSTAAGADWAEFLAHPNAGSLATLTSQLDVSRCDWGSEANEKVVPSDARNQLFRLISMGNDQAFIVGLLTSKCFDGGDLGDLKRSSGTYLELRTEQFLVAVEANQTPDSDIASMATSLPLKEGIDPALRTVSKRLSLLRVIDNARLQGVRDVSIRGLEAQLERLETTKAKLDHE